MDEVYREYTEKSRVEIAGLKKQRDKEKEKREEARSEILKLESEIAQGKEELAETKALIAEMTPNELTEGINEFIDDEAKLIASGNISLSPRGGVLTLSIFEEKIISDRLVVTKDNVISEKNVSILSLERDIVGYKEEIILNKDGWAKADELKNVVLEDNTALEKALSAQRWKSFGTGAVTIAIAVAIIRLSGVLK
tara:strand:- start:349 stop:936 length:588 start_codon:yes stop_codon:yes gene_type:complete